MAHSSTNLARLKNKDFANKIRHGSPKLQEMLREKCRLRMREKRSQLFNRYRFGSEFNRHLQDTFTEIVREEIKQITTSDWNDRDKANEIDESLTQEQEFEFENQLLKEQEQWMLQNYDRILQEETEYLVMFADNDNDDVVCPTCQKAVLAEESNCLTCAACGLMLAGRTMQEAKHLIDERVCEHATKCAQTPTFTVLYEGNNISLYMVCYECSTLTLIC